jgi:hypothetical protein
MALIYRTVGLQLDIAQSVLVPRLADNRFNGNEQTLISVALTEIAKCRGMLPDTNIMAEGERQGCYDNLQAQLTLLRPLDADKQLADSWEFYNAIDLISDASDNILAGEAGSISDL